MYKKSFNIKIAFLATVVFIFSCTSDQNEKKVPDLTKDSIQNKSDGAGKGDTSTAKKDDVPVSTEPAKTKSIVKDSSATSNSSIKNAEKKIKEKKALKNDSASTTKNGAATAVKKDIPAATPATPQSTAKPANAEGGAPVFKAKYGIIPRDATESNITGFLNAFPDKSTIIKVNFDGPADAEMNAVKAQITKVLKKSGYTNVQSQSATIEPQRMPKEIHYELQRDGSVVFWVPPANQE